MANAHVSLDSTSVLLRLVDLIILFRSGYFLVFNKCVNTDCFNFVVFVTTATLVVVVDVNVIAGVASRRPHPHE